jgi:hypothetical protein
MPDDQRQLGNLLSLLAEFHQSRLPAIRIKQLCNPNEDLSVLIADATIHDRHRTGQSAFSIQGCGTGTLRCVPSTTVPSHSDAIIMLLLSGSRGGGSSLNLSMLSHQRRMLLLGLVWMGLGRMVLLLWLLLLLLLML